MARASKSNHPVAAPALADPEGSGEASPAEYQLPPFLRLDDETLVEVRATEALIDQQQRILLALQRELLQLITTRCRVNLDTEHWELDSRRGLLERKQD